jgi:LacI family transcriptional regulator
MRSTIHDVAEAAGVSAMTVSRVVNGNPRVSDETRKRVDAAIVELDYVPNQLARGLIRRHSQTLGVVVPDIANPFFTMAVRGAEQIAWRNGYRLILCNTRSEVDREREYLEELIAFQVDGVMLAPVGDKSRSNLQFLTTNELPFVLVDRTVRGYVGDVVHGDNRRSARTLVEHLIALGHERIAIVVEPTSVSTARERLSGYRQALEAAALEFRSSFVITTSAIDPRAGRDAAFALFDLPETPSAIFAVNNIVAIGVADAARERQLSIPRDIAIVCFDDLGYASHFHPFLTVMAQPAESFGTTAMQLLLDRVTGGDESGVRNIVLPAHLQIHESSGPEDI